jgi:putative transposase
MELDTKVWFFSIYKRKRISAFIVDETVIQIGNQHFWLWIAIEPVKRTVLGNTYFK